MADRYSHPDLADIVFAARLHLTNAAHAFPLRPIKPAKVNDGHAERASSTLDKKRRH